MTKESTFKRRKIGSLTNQCVTAIKKNIHTLGSDPITVVGNFGAVPVFGLKFEKSLYNLNAMEKVFIRF